jgi:mitochondrial fission protein ELM1
MNQAKLYSWYEQNDESDVHDPRVIATADVFVGTKDSVALHCIALHTLKLRTASKMRNRIDQEIYTEVNLLERRARPVCGHYYSRYPSRGLKFYRAYSMLTAFCLALQFKSVYRKTYA